MENLKYDKILNFKSRDEKIKYGILFGNEKIVFIKSGAPKDIVEDEGKIESKYVDKYLIMAHRVHARMGATVICASNCDLDGNIQLKADKALIEKIISNRGFEDYELYFVGNSDGGEHSLKLAQQFPETVTFFGINSSWSDMDIFLERIQSIPHVKKIFVYGEKDVDFHDIAPKLKEIACDNLKIAVLGGVDHDFTGRVDEFIDLIDLL